MGLDVTDTSRNSVYTAGVVWGLYMPFGGMESSNKFIQSPPFGVVNPCDAAVLHFI